MIATLATIVALSAAPAPAAPAVTTAGQVASMPAPRMFTVLVGDRRVLVYASQEQAQRVQIGVRVQVVRTVPRDWLKLAADELQASYLQVQP